MHSALYWSFLFFVRSIAGFEDKIVWFKTRFRRFSGVFKRVELVLIWLRHVVARDKIRALVLSVKKGLDFN